MRRKRSAVKALVTATVLFLMPGIPALYSLDQVPPEQKTIAGIARPAIKNFTNKDGLPVDSVMTFERDARGFLWIGTQDGAAVFNGHDFTVIDMPDRGTSNYIYDILAAKDGSIWFATSVGGIHQLVNNEWLSYTNESGLASNEIRALLETISADDTKTLWVGRRDGLSKFSGGVWENFDDTDGLPDKRVRCLIEVRDTDGTSSVWVGTYGGIAVWNGGVQRIFDQTDGLPGKIIFSLLKTETKTGEEIIWAGTDEGLAKFEAGVWKTFENESGILTKSIRSLGKSQKGDGTQTIWVGFDGAGLAYLENGQWFFLDENRGLPNNLVFAFAETGAPDGSIWMSNLAAGISRFERSNWHAIDDRNGLPNKIAFSIGETISKNGESSFWIGTFGGGLARFEKGVWRVFTKADGLSDDFITALLGSKDETGEPILYVGLEAGLYSFQDGRFKKIELNETKRFVEVWDLKETENETGEKTLLISTSLGLIKKTGEKIEKITDQNGLPDPNVRDTVETVSRDGRKTLWVGTYNGGLARFEDGNWTIIDNTNGLPTNRIYSLAEIQTDSTRELWVGTGGGGIAVLDLNSPQPDFQIISTKNGNLLPNDTVYQIFQDEKQRIYATTNKGVSRITRNENGLNAYFFTTEDGLPNNNCIAGAGFVDSRNRVWVGTVGGAAFLDVGDEFEDNIADPLFLERILIGDKETRLVPDTALAFDQNNLTFEFSMPTGFRESATRYRTQLVGLEEKPTDWTVEPRRELTFLPSGEYVFKAWGRDAAGNVSSPLEIAFAVRPAWWQTWWAFGLYLLTAAGLAALIAYAFYRNRLKRMLELERVRMRIATDLHDDIGASLSQISILSEILANKHSGEGDEEEIHSLNLIAETSREMTASMSDVVWAINPKRDLLRDLVQRMRRFASDILSAKDIDFEFIAPPTERDLKLDVDTRQQIYLVFKESVNNAVKHSNCTRVEIEFQKNDRQFTLRVSDNGTGFETGAESEGNGLASMKMRAEKAGGAIKINSEKGVGTTVLLTVPYKFGIFA